MRILLLALVFLATGYAHAIDSKVKDGYADSNGVKIHYVSLGERSSRSSWHPRLSRFLVHVALIRWPRFPINFSAWPSIKARFPILSDKPVGVENYDMRLLVGDVIADVIKSLGG